MPNRGELAVPAMRTKRGAAMAGPTMLDADAWTVIGFCAIGWHLSFYLAVSSMGADAMPDLLTQIPWG